MVNYKVTDTDLTAVANAIRAKSGGSAALAFPAGFVSEIGNIPSGGGELSPTDWFTGDVPEKAIIGDVLPRGANAFEYAPFKVIRWELTTNTASRITTAYIFSHTDAEVLVMPYYTGTFDNLYVFRDSKKLKVLDTRMTNFNNTICNGCSVLDTIILRSPTLARMGDVNALGGTSFDSNGSGGTLYVPQALISTYQSATNWSKILGYTNNQILPIEGSIYETQYADGTPVA